MVATEFAFGIKFGFGCADDDGHEGRSERENTVGCVCKKKHNAIECIVYRFTTKHWCESRRISVRYLQHQYSSRAKKKKKRVGSKTRDA